MTNVTDAQIEAWEKAVEQKVDTDYPADFDFENAILTAQEEDETWWG